MKKILIVFIIGRIALEVWTALLPQEQMSRIVAMTNVFVEQQSCYKVKLTVDEGDEEVVFTARCLEVFL